MRPHLNALRARVQPHVRCWVGEVPEKDQAGVDVRPPFASVSGPSWDAPEDLPVCGITADLDSDVRVMVTAWSEGAVHDLLSAVRADLSPSLIDTALLVEGRHARVMFVRSEFVRVATESPTDLATGRHMVTGVDTYRIYSQPV